MTRFDIRLFQNYSPCDDYQHGDRGEKRGCASDIIEFKQQLEKSRKVVNITITFSNFYKHYHFHNIAAGLRKLRAEGVELNLLQGDENWRTFFDHDLVDLGKVKQPYLTSITRNSNSTDKPEVDGALILLEFKVTF